MNSLPSSHSMKQIPPNWSSLALDSRQLQLRTKDYATICLGMWTSAFSQVIHHHYHQNGSDLRNNLLTPKVGSVRLQAGKQKPLYIFKGLVGGFNVGKSWLTQTVGTAMWVKFRVSATSDLSLTHQSAVLKSAPSSHFNSQDLLGRSCQLFSSKQWSRKISRAYLELPWITYLLITLSPGAFKNQWPFILFHLWYLPWVTLGFTQNDTGRGCGEVECMTSLQWCRRNLGMWCWW